MKERKIQVKKYLLSIDKKVIKVILELSIHKLGSAYRNVGHHKLRKPMMDILSVGGVSFCPSTGGSVRFRPVSIVLNNDNRTEPQVNRRLGFEAAP